MCNYPKLSMIDLFVKKFFVNYVKTQVYHLSFSPGWCYQPELKKHTDRVFLSSACEPLDQGCVSFECL